jgi:hypothetical protein
MIKGQIMLEGVEGIERGVTVMRTLSSMLIVAIPPMTAADFRIEDTL